MIGNDIVDLKQASLESNWKRKRFLNKVFTQKEQTYISKSEYPHQMVWQLWSMKESAYKINVKQYQNRFFNPKKIECTFIDYNHGAIIINDMVYYTKSEVNTDYIYTVATLNQNSQISNCFKIKESNYSTQHQTCYDKLKQEVSQKSNIKKESISIKKDIKGIPKLYGNNKLLNLDCSITHHGYYGAYALQ